jgi:hypothetical protein
MSDPIPNQSEGGNPFAASQTVGAPHVHDPAVEESNISQAKKNAATPFERAPKHLLLMIFAGVLVWGIIHMIGSWIGGQPGIKLRNDLVRGLIVLVCVGIFLGGWRLLLNTQKPRVKKYRIPKPTAEVPKQGPDQYEESK